jgi:transposase, IS6 family
MGERGVAVNHTTLYRWVQHYAPELEKRTLWYPEPDQRWQVDETYIRVGHFAGNTYTGRSTRAATR